MERYNAFNLIHKGLRAALYQTALQLQQTDFTVAEETELAVSKVKEIVMLFDGHAQKEDGYILPAIQAYEPSVVATFESEHETDLQLGEQLNEAVEKLRRSEELLEKLVAGRELTVSFVAFMSFNLNHMAKEEDIINRILWRYYSDDEIKQISGRIAQSIAPWIQDFYATWMLRGINTQEAIEWIGAVKRGMPEVVSQTLIAKAKQELPESRFRQVSGALNQEELAAA